MKTKNGDCDNCPLKDNKNNPEFLLAKDKSNVSNPDIFVVADIKKNGKKLFDFFKDKYSNKKFLVLNHVICDSNDEDSYKCHNHCFSNFRALSKNIEAVNCFIYDLQYKDIDINGFTVVKDIKDFEDKLNEIYNIKKQEDIVKSFTFKIPDQFYTNNYRLIDIQKVNSQKKLLYIFRDKDNKKVIYDYPMLSDNYYWYQSIASNRIIEKIDNLKLYTGKYSSRDQTKNGYGSDVDICTAHCVDYYLNNIGECRIIRPNILFFDIETYQFGDNIFPNPDDVDYPIVAISFRTEQDNDHTHVYLVTLDGQIDKTVYEKVKQYSHVTIFKDEISMLRMWLQQVRKLDVDYLCGWNISGFDVPYIVNRCKRIGIRDSELSPYGDVWASGERAKNSIAGMVALDQLTLFREFTHGVRPSYSLNNIAKEVLGETKVDHSGKSIDDMYRYDIDLYLKYSTTDTDLIYEMEKKLGHINLQNEIRKVATCSHEAARTTLGQADGIYQTAMKKKGLISRNYLHDVPREKLDGAYVFDPRPGIYDGMLCDFDFKSLYPSIICTWNIGPDTYIGKISKEDAFSYIFHKDTLKNRTIEIVLDPLYACKKTVVKLVDFEKFLDKYHAQVTIIGTIFCGHDIKESINYKVLNGLMDSRKFYKDKMLNAKEAGDKTLAREYNDAQLAFKIIANALYGALGQEHFRFYNPILGESITATGQEMLKYCAVHADYYMMGKYKKQNGDDFVVDPNFATKVKNTKYIVYGDTDSVFVYLTDYIKSKGLKVEKSQEVLDLVSTIQKFINGVIIPTVLSKHHVNLKKSQMYLKNEFLMNRYYALNAKKKYASHIISQEGKSIDEVDIKGLEIKRSEIPTRSQKLLKEIVDIILEKKWLI